MKTCSKCGNTFEDSKFCPACGTEYKETLSFDAEDVKESKIWAILAYIGPLFLVPLIGAPKSKYARFHANQGLALFVPEVIVLVAYKLLNWVNGWVFTDILNWGSDWKTIIPDTIGFIVTVGAYALACLFAVLAVVGIVNAWQGKASRLPYVGNKDYLKK